MNGQRIATLTGLRGIAAIWVATFHGYGLAASLLGGPPRSDVPGVREGFLAVDLFFILSGFVLCVAYADKFRLDFRLSLADFAIARVHRIFPLHWAALAAMLMLVAFHPHIWLGPGPFTPKAFALSAALVQNWNERTALAWNHPAWSLSAEWSAYIVFPVLVYALNCVSNRRLAACGAIVALTTLVVLILRAGSDDLNHVGPPGFVRCLCEFIAGMLAWKAATLGNPPSTRGAETLFAAGIALLGFAVCEPAYQLLAPFAFLALVVGCALPCRIADWMFGNRLCVFLGDISFSIYLVHIVVLAFVAIAADTFDVIHSSLPIRLLTVLALPASILSAAYLTRTFIEIPFQALPRAWVLSHRSLFARATPTLGKARSIWW